MKYPSHGLDLSSDIIALAASRGLCWRCLVQCGRTKIFGLVVVDVVLNAQRLIVSPIGGIVFRKIPASLERGTIIVRL